MRFKMSFRFTIQYQLGYKTGIKEVTAENQQQAVLKLWEEIARTLGIVINNSYKSASIINVQM